jgi:hypothetical protein
MDTTIISNQELIALKEENEELKELVSEQSGKLERAIHAICELHAGLCNIRTQNHCILLANARLYGEEQPTSTKGDHHEKRISILEEMVKSLEEKINILEKRHA